MAKPSETARRGYGVPVEVADASDAGLSAPACAGDGFGSEELLPLVVVAPDPVPAGAGSPMIRVDDLVPLMTVPSESPPPSIERKLNAFAR